MLSRAMYIPDMEVHLSRSASFMRRMANEMRKRTSIAFRSQISKSQTRKSVCMMGRLRYLCKVFRSENLLRQGGSLSAVTRTRRNIWRASRHPADLNARKVLACSRERNPEEPWGKPAKRGDSVRRNPQEEPAQS